MVSIFITNSFPFFGSEITFCIYFARTTASLKFLYSFRVFGAIFAGMSIDSLAVLLRIFLAIGKCMILVCNIPSAFIFHTSLAILKAIGFYLFRMFSIIFAYLGSYLSIMLDIVSLATSLKTFYTICPSPIFSGPFIKLTQGFDLTALATTLKPLCKQPFAFLYNRAFMAFFTSASPTISAMPFSAKLIKEFNLTALTTPLLSMKVKSQLFHKSSKKETPSAYGGFLPGKPAGLQGPYKDKIRTTLLVSQAIIAYHRTGDLSNASIAISH